MPFTLAHPAIIIPLARTKRFSITALTMGSIVPDFEFFFQMREVQNIGHHWFGIFLFDLPMGIMLCYLFHILLRDPLIGNLPPFFRQRLFHFSGRNWPAYAARQKTVVVYSLLAGVLTHLAWDSMTHSDGLIVELFPYLSTKLDTNFGQLPIYYVLQILFSMLGLMVMAYCFLKLPVDKNMDGKAPDVKYWTVFGVSVMSILAARLTGWPQYNSFWGVFMAVMGSLSYSWIIISILYRKKLIIKKSELL